MSCLRCPSGCDTCKRETFCDKCVWGFYLEYSKNAGGITGFCKACNKNGEYVDSIFSSEEGFGVCLTHSECPIKNCIKCSNKLKECQTCEEKYFLHKFGTHDACSPCTEDSYVKIDPITNQLFCLRKTLIAANLSTTRNPKSFLLTFNETWDDYFSNYSKNFKIELSNLTTADYNCKINQEKSFRYIFGISCEILKNISAGESLHLTLLNLPNETEYSDIAIRTKEYKLPMKTYIVCPENYTLNDGKYSVYFNRFN